MFMRPADEHKKQTKIRQALLANGYRPLPTANKIAFQKGWPGMEVTDKTIRTWPVIISPGGRKAPAVTTAIQMAGDLVGIDVDVLDGKVVQKLFDLAEKTFGAEWADHVLIRVGKPPKELWLFRTDKPFGMWKTPRYEDKDGGDHMIEVYGGDATRYFSCYGPHSFVERDVFEKVFDPDTKEMVATDNVVDRRPNIVKGEWEVAREYEWDGDSPLDVAADELPVVDTDTLLDFLTAADDLMAGVKGWERIKSTRGGSFEGGVAYDLTEDMEFDTAEGRLPYWEAFDYALGERDARCSASFIDGINHKNKTRCRMAAVGTSEAPGLQVFDHEAWVQHMPVDWAPESPEERREKAEALGDKLKEIASYGDLDNELEEAKYDPDEFDAFEAAVEDILSRFAINYQSGFFHEARPGVEDTGVAPRVMKQNYAGSVLNYERPSKAAEGVMLQRKVNPVDVACDIWAQSGGRVFDRVGFDPRTTEWVYQEDALSMMNTWHGLPEIGEADEEGVTMVWQFLEHLIPDDDERAFFLDWLATKYRAPWKRMCAILFLAPNESGTGRGTLYAMLNEMFGRYATTPRENELKEKFNGWMERTVLGLVNEFGTSARFDDKRAEYQQMKDLVDPTNNFMTVRRMRTEGYRAQVFTSIIAATNNLRGVALDDEDRRFAVLTNGSTLNKVKGWADRFMEVRRTDLSRLTAALTQIVREHKVLTSEQDLDTPPKFAGWSEIVAANDTELDEAIKTVVARAKGRAAWTTNNLKDEVRLEMFGDRKARKGDGVAGALAELRGERAERFGLWSMGVMKHTDKATSGLIFSTDPTWFRGLTMEERGKVLDRDPDARRAHALSVVPKSADE